ncbi:MAG: hypothetical protein ACYC9W_08165, partial [Candidatus Limnocylindria bacterium]
MIIKLRRRADRHEMNASPSAGPEARPLVAAVDGVGNDPASDIVLGPVQATVPQTRRRSIRATTFESLEVRDFRVLWFGFMGTWFAMQIQQVARGYLAYELTGSALA